MDIKDKVLKLNSPEFLKRREKQLKYMLFDKLGFSSDSLGISISPRIDTKSADVLKSHGIETDQKELLTDIWNIDFAFEFQIETEYVLAELAHQLNLVERKLYGFFNTFKINQFYDIVPNDNEWPPGLIGISDLFLNNDGIMNLSVWIDYETEGVDGGGF
jgi:hypothetical protein